MPQVQDVSNTHFRYFMRLLTKQSTIYTQMLHHNAITHHHTHLLPFHPSQHPIVLQLGGCDPVGLADAAEIGARYGYDEINLNVGCPSPRVQSGSFGACLMRQPQLVYQCMKQMRLRLKGLPCTVKCRLGVDEFDSYQFVRNFIEEVSKNGNVQHFIIHARKAFLKGLNPAQNRSVPPLMYDRVFKLQQDFPHLKFTINGGIKTIQQASKLLTQHKLYGCMIGRTAYQNPYQLVKADSVIYGKDLDKPLPTRQQIILKYADYLDTVQNKEYFNQIGPGEEQKVDELLGVDIKSIKHHYVNPSVLVKPLINMFHGCKNNSVYRQLLSDPKRLKIQPLSDVVKQALQAMKLEMKKHSSKHSSKDKQQQKTLNIVQKSQNKMKEQQTTIMQTKQQKQQQVKQQQVKQQQVKQQQIKQ